MPTIETMMEALRKSQNCVLDLSEATEREIQTEYSMLKILGLLADNSKPSIRACLIDIKFIQYLELIN